jgi:CheY-like chemotaxis protein
MGVFPADYRLVAISQPQTSRQPRCLRLIAVGGRGIEVRMVQHGDRFGPNNRAIYQSYRPCVEMTRARTRPGRAYLNTFSSDLLGELLAPYPILPVTNDGSVRIPPEEVRRLVEWVDDPDSFRFATPITTLVAASAGRGDAIAAELPGHEFAVSVAIDGDEALRFTAQRRPALVVAEAGLPRLEGLQLARELRRSAAMASAVVLLVGANADDEFALSAGVNACLPWPLEADAFRTMARELFGLV